MINAYPEKPMIPYERTSVPMHEVVSYMQGVPDIDPEIKRAAYIMFRVESANGASGVCNNYVGCQADSGRWPDKFDASIVGIVEKEENGTGKTRLFVAFDKWQSSIDFLLDRVAARGLYIGAKALPISHLLVSNETELVRAYTKEWAKGDSSAEPDASTIASWHSMYGQAAALFRHGAAAPAPTPAPAPPPPSELPTSEKPAVKNNIATPAAAGGAAGASVVIITWALGLMHITVPAEVAAAMMVLAAPLLHLVAVRIGAEPSNPTP